MPSAELREQLKQATAAIDPTVPLTSVSAFDTRVARVLQRDRFNVLFVRTFAAMAVLLAVVGLHGAIAFAVAARTRELGVRLALGADPQRLVRATLWQSGRIGVIGGLVGIAATIAFARVIGNAWYLVPGSHNGLLYNVTTTDPAALLLSFLAVVAVAFAAATIPAAPRQPGRSRASAARAMTQAPVFCPANMTQTHTGSCENSTRFQGHAGQCSLPELAASWKGREGTALDTSRCRDDASCENSRLSQGHQRRPAGRQCNGLLEGTSAGHRALPQEIPYCHFRLREPEWCRRIEPSDALQTLCNAIAGKVTFTMVGRCFDTTPKEPPWASKTSRA